MGIFILRYKNAIAELIFFTYNTSKFEKIHGSIIGEIIALVVQYLHQSNVKSVPEYHPIIFYCKLLQYQINLACTIYKRRSTAVSQKSKSTEILWINVLAPKP